MKRQFKILLLYILHSLLLSPVAFSSRPDTTKSSFNDHDYFYISKAENKQLILFLHGGIANPYFKEHRDNIEPEYLLENNVKFTNKAAFNGYDLLIPVSADSLNWLDQPGYCYREFKNYIKGLTKEYAEIHIAGFSDGGTGSFKIFYSFPSYFTSLIVFNGYPQHRNFASGVDYSAIRHKKILFLGGRKDKNIPYEFMLTEYAAQKAYNPNTFIYLNNGAHDFSAYSESDFDLVFEILNDKNTCTRTSPLHGFIKNDSLIEFYTFRKKIVRKFGYGKDFLLVNRRQRKKLKAK